MNNPINDVIEYLRIFRIYVGKQMYLVFLFTFFATLSETVGLVMLLPLFETLGLDDSGAGQEIGSSSVELSAAAEYSYAFLEFLSIDISATSIIVFIIVSFLIKGFLTFFALGFNAYLRGRLLESVKTKLFMKYSHMSYSYYTERDAGYFINVINEQINLMIQSFFFISQLVTQIINLLVYLIFAFIIAWEFGLMALIGSLLIFIAFRSLNTYVRKLSRKRAKEEGKLAKLLIQVLHAYKYLSATDQVSKVGTSIKKTISQLASYQKLTGIASSFTQAIREPIIIILVMSIIMIQVVKFEQPIAPIMVSILLFYRGLNSALAVQSFWQKTLESIGSVELIHSEFSEQNKYQEKNGVKKIGQFKKSISFNNVCFNYKYDKKYVLKNITLEIPALSSTAFVGESGSGKSTLLDIIAILHKPTHGKVLIDGVLSTEVETSSWRRQIGYVSQEAVIFDDTIAHNICLSSDRNEEYNMSDVKQAAKQAFIHEYIESLPDGYKTVVGDRGVRLSGGQRQRLFIARELYRKPNLLILDEATSSLDSESENAIQKSIDDLKGKITLIIVAHRLSTVRNADFINVLDKGEIIEKGSFIELKNDNNSKFNRLIKMQSL